MSNSTISSPIPKVYNMSGMKGLVGKRNEKQVEFMGEPLKISKLSLADVSAIQAMSKEGAENEQLGIEVIRTVIRMAAEGAADLSDQEMDSFPLDDLNGLSRAIMEFSGIGGKESGE